MYNNRWDYNIKVLTLYILGEGTLPEKRSVNFQLGIHPINWIGEDVREHGEHTTYQHVLDDIRALGLTGTEMSRRFPTDTKVLKKELGSRGIQLVSQWKSVLFSSPEHQKQELAAYREHALFLQEMGSKVISTAEVGGSFFTNGPRYLSDDAWEWLAEGLNRAGEVAQEYGMKLTYHHHAGTVVEQPEEIDRLMEMTDSNLVYLLYDTGHALYGGNEPFQLLRKYYDRIAYIHLKDVRQSVLAEAREEKADFLTCIRKGVFTVPGDGCIDFIPIFRELVEREYGGWALLEGEQDPEKHNPFTLAKEALQYIYTITEQIGENA